MRAAAVRAFRALAASTGIALGWAILAPVYLVCFVPARLVLILRRRDPLRRRFPAPERSCWTRRPVSPPADRRRRPFA